jgi:hypothetical protein
MTQWKKRFTFQWPLINYVLFLLKTRKPRHNFVLVIQTPLKSGKPLKRTYRTKEISYGPDLYGQVQIITDHQRNSEQCFALISWCKLCTYFVKGKYTFLDLLSIYLRSTFFYLSVSMKYVATKQVRWVRPGGFTLNCNSESRTLSTLLKILKNPQQWT